MALVSTTLFASNAPAAQHRVKVTVVTPEGKAIADATVTLVGQPITQKPDGRKTTPVVFSVDSDRIALFVASRNGNRAEVGVVLPAERLLIDLLIVYYARGQAVARVLPESVARVLSVEDMAFRSAPFTGQQSGSTAGAGCGSTTITQNVDDSTIVRFNSVSCNTDGINSDNYYTRSYDLALMAPGQDWVLECVDFGVELNDDDYTVEVNVYHDPSGTAPTDGPATCGSNDWVLLGSVSQFIPGGTVLAVVSSDFSGQNVLLPANSTIVVEIFTPDGGVFFIGTNDAGESAPTYVSAATCSIPCNTALGDIGFAAVHMVQRLDLDPSGPVFGACCDPEALPCQDNVLSTDCPAAFTANTLCAALSPQCGAPDNDDCSAFVIEIEDDGVFDFDNTSATMDGPGDDPNCEKSRSTIIDHDVWYCWTAGCAGDVTISTCGLTDVNTKLAVYDGCDCAGITESLDCNDNTCGLQSQVSFTAVPNAQYLIRVGTFQNAAGGTGQFSITSTGQECVSPTGTDDCASGPTPIAGTGLFPFDNSNATTDGPAIDPNCDVFGEPSVDNDVWFCWTAPCTGEAIVNTCDLTSVDTKIAVYDSCACPSNNSSLDCNDDSCFTQSEVSFDVVTGQEYLIRVGIFPGALGGTGSMLIDCQEPGVGACCLDAEFCTDGLTPSECQTQGGFHQGASSVCTDVDCSEGDCGASCAANTATTGPATLVNGGAPTDGWTDAGIVDDFSLPNGGTIACIHAEFLTIFNDGNHTTMRARVYPAPAGIAGLGNFLDAVPVFDQTFHLGVDLTHTDTGQDVFGADLVAFDAMGPTTNLPPGNYALHLSFPGTAGHGFWATAAKNGTDCMAVWGESVALPSDLCRLVGSNFEAASFALCATGLEEFGACCDDDTGVCMDDVSNFDCSARFAANTACANLDPACGQAVGACCLADETCQEDLSQVSCFDTGGIFQGMGVSCTPDPCFVPSICDGLIGDCCVEHETPGCDDTSCCELICTIDPFCCDVAWDGICANQASDLCLDVCGPLDPCDGATGDCFLDNGTPGCDDPACCELICAHNAFCCSVAWDQACADEALVNCAGEATGGCCVQGECSILTATECGALGGDYLGDDTECGSDGVSTTLGPGIGDALPDGDPLGITSVINIADSGVAAINDINIELNVTHTWVGDLCATVEHNGVVATLLQRMGANSGTCHFGEPFGCGEDNLTVTLDGDASENVNDLCVLNLSGSFQPHDATSLDAFDGLPLDGDWTLTISDNASTDSGMLDSWNVVHTEPGMAACPIVGACCRCPGNACVMTTADDCTGEDSYLGDMIDCGKGGGRITVIEVSGLGLAIPDGDPAAGATHELNMDQSFVIEDVDVDVQITHTWVGDLVVEVAHGGVMVTIVNQPGDSSDTPGNPFGCAMDNYDILLDDEGFGGAIENQCTMNLGSPPNYRPNNPLSAFDAMDSAGIWTITVTDTAGGEPGTLDGWSVHIQEEFTGPGLCEGVCPECGNGIVEGAEDCDDGNTTDGDCCSSTCAFEAVGSACGDAPTECSGQDTCDGAGNCEINDFAPGIDCGEGPAECSDQDTCDGIGGCTNLSDLPAGSVCGDGGSECSDQDTCDGIGGCTNLNDLPAGSVCGDGGTECSDQDTCDGNGGCTNLNDVADGTNCGAEATECSGQDTCSGGACVPNDLPSGMLCGSPGDDCTAPDTCSGGGVCNPGVLIIDCINDDGCCADGCTHENDNDCPLDVPTVSEWGLLILTLLLLVGSKVYFGGGRQTA